MTRIVAHRGASAEAPENSLQAFQRAIELGADMIEFDVRRARDGRLVISHDPIPEFAHHHLPTLEDTLRLTRGRIQLDVELKEAGCERDAIRLLLAQFAPDEFCITSFLAPVLREVRAANPHIRTGLIFERLPRKIAASEADLLAPHFSLIDQAEQISKPLYVWTVDDPALMRTLFARPSVEAIITNNPRQALELRRQVAGN